jgi:hypothetical protein
MVACDEIKIFLTRRRERFADVTDANLVIPSPQLVDTEHNVPEEVKDLEEVKEEEEEDPKVDTVSDLPHCSVVELSSCQAV